MGWNIEADKLYVMDRGDAKFALFNSVVNAESSFHAVNLRSRSLRRLLTTPSKLMQVVLESFQSAPKQHANVKI